MARSWYVYWSGDPLDASNYRIITIKHECLCGDKLCTIYATGNDYHPISPLSENLKKYIVAALATGQIQPERPYLSKKYVYLKYSS